MGDALQRKVDRIARRQWYVLVLLVYPYLAAGVRARTDEAADGDTATE